MTTTPTEEQRRAASDFVALCLPTRTYGTTGADLLANLAETLTWALAALLAEREAPLRERLEKAERDYRIVEAAIRWFGFPVVEAEPAAAAIRKLGEERDEARAQVEVLREELARVYENQAFLLVKEEP